MCGRFALTDIDAVFSQYRVLISEDLTIGPRYNIAPSQHTPVIYLNREKGRVLEMMRWGLVPFWAKDPKIGNRMINARAETLDTKPSFRHILKSKRCLVPSSGFYEWKRVAKSKLPHYIKLKNREIFSFAGLYDIWRDGEGSELKTFTIITTESNMTLRPIHDRMPVILRQECEDAWLGVGSPELNSDALMAMLRPYPDDDMDGEHSRFFVKYNKRS
ncbi:MAG: SOS response-associated peptidase [Candidatus Scalindua sp.]|nr:SOS response-associated peptidase [Candidatus Scalindua sp.]